MTKGRGRSRTPNDGSLIILRRGSGAATLLTAAGRQIPGDRGDALMVTIQKSVFLAFFSRSTEGDRDAKMLQMLNQCACVVISAEIATITSWELQRSIKFPMGRRLNVRGVVGVCLFPIALRLRKSSK